MVLPRRTRVPQPIAEAAKTLLGVSEDLGLDVIYLAGYIVECSLKALIRKSTPTRKRKEAPEEISSGSTCHNFGFLTEVLRMKRVAIPPNIRASLESTKREWNTRLRYHGALVPYNEASEFLENALRIFRWVGGRM